ncbi:MAG: S9 family peptidase [Phycisphaerae bacterium]|nr:S9 family peptidase [Phycisphaerae bacterium]
MSMKTLTFSLSVLTVVAGRGFAEVRPPVAERVPVVDTYHGVSVTDEYQWLEKWDDPRVQAWSEGQNAYARSVLDSLPNVGAIRARVSEILSAPTESYFELSSRPGKLFAMKRQPPKQQPFLIVMDGPGDASGARVLVDPNKLDAKGTTAIDWYVPSPDGKTVAVSISEGGSESGDLHLFDAASGEQLEAPIARVQGGTAGGSLAWLDNTTYLYTRYPREGEKSGDDRNFFVRVFKHTIGTDAAHDTYEIGDDFPKIAEIQLDVDGSSGRALATVQLGDGGQFSLYLRSKEGKWTQFAGYEDQVDQAVFGPRDDLFLVSYRGGPRGEILRLGVDDLKLSSAKVVVPQGADAVVTSFLSEPPSVVATKDRLFVTYQTGGPSELRAFDLEGRSAAGPEQLPVSVVAGLVMVGDSLLFNNSSYLHPAAWYRFDPKSGATERTSLATSAVVNLDDCEVVREFATSQDGTKVPVNIIRPKGIKLDGSHALILNGYGGYGVNINPRFRPLDRVVLEQGVVYAVANIRGGGEFGEEWHLNGNLTKKQNVFDDFAAVARHLIERGYTTSERLGIIGGSNGGLLMGATFTQNPTLAKAVVSSVGIYDMLRVELSPNGAFNVPEFGTVKDEAQFRALHAYSPYHHVKDGTAYPSILFMTGANDPRVDPMHSRKMTARLQAASPGTRVLLRTSMDSGHGLDTSLSEQIAQQTDVYAFLFAELGVKYKAVE